MREKAIWLEESAARPIENLRDILAGEAGRCEAPMTVEAKSEDVPKPGREPARGVEGSSGRGVISPDESSPSMLGGLEGGGRGEVTRSPPSLCLRSWRARVALSVKALLQSLNWQTNGRSPVCTRSWMMRPPLWAKARPQPGTEQTKGRSPVCRRSWRVRCDPQENALPQPWKEHVNGRSPVCVRRCSARRVVVEKLLPQSSWGQTWMSLRARLGAGA
mmetsp:Transcript_423/g.1159  ORF Transcript_423/g.1159 Transcript_423/m.1159 type:complete len:218 (+) Transcript_423:561-1214(+)